MPDIFISYSRKDSEQALTLAEKLRAQGMTVWIDQHGIGAATSWSKEIVTAIDDCKAFLVLLSESSIQSVNVNREVSIASESNKRMLPIAIEDIKLNNDMRYHLAGIQRVAYSEFGAITEALHSLGVIPEKQASEKKQDNRTSLLVMPFEDLSPTQDNLWFADGLAGELIDKLSHIKSLRIVDRKTSQDLRNSRLNTYEIASTLEVEYLIQGSVRKFDDQIKISVSLFDVKEADYLWQQSHKGVMQDVFDLQESVADKVIEELKIKLGADEIKALSRNKTENAEAYEFWLKGRQQYYKFSRKGMQHAVQLYSEAVELDPKFTTAMSDIANAECTLYENYDRSPERLERAEGMIERIREIEGESARWYWLLSRIWLAKGDLEKTEQYARQSVELDPISGNAHDTLGFALRAKGDFNGAAEAWEQCARLRESVIVRFCHIVALHDLGDRDRLSAASLEAIPEFERHLKLNPDDFHASTHYAITLFFAGERKRAHEHALKLMETISPDGFSYINLSSLFCQLGEYSHAIVAIRKSIECGFTGIQSALSTSEFDPLRSMPEFQEIVQKMSVKSVKTAVTAG